MSDTRPIPWPWSMKRSPMAISEVPDSIKELFGRKCRVVHFGDKTLQQIVGNRITIVLDDDSRICEIYVEPSEKIDK
ncbi:TPA: hypothetical protein OTY99_003114 [Citrobacter freundii]|nr:hypothetical protein [Citrobacter freundii]HEI8703803.1 hypothetical protein [Citrobacter freundii]